jgi:hypothetical protein
MSVVIRIVSGSANADMAYNLQYRSIEFNNKNGYDGGIYVDGFFIYACIVFCMQNKVAAMTHTWTWINWALWVASTLGFLLFAFVYSQIVDLSFDWYKVVDFSMGTGVFYQGVFVVMWLMIMTDFVLRKTSEMFFPSSMSRLQLLSKSENKPRVSSDEIDANTRVKYNRQVIIV